jgi:paraquat-inducible protein A
MKLENEDDLDNLILCHQCYTLHKEIPIADGTKACCSECGGILYRYDSRLVDHGLAWSITGFIFFALANLFPIVQIELLGHEQFITIPKTFVALFDNGFYIVGLLCAFLIFIFPLMVFTINILLFLLLKLQVAHALTKELLMFLSYIKPWSMSDIFLISILVALVKLIGYAQIHMGVAFWALTLYVLIDLYITKQIHVSEIWMLRKRLYEHKGHR